MTYYIYVPAWLCILVTVIISLSLIFAGIAASHIRDHWWTWGYFFRNLFKRKGRDE